MVARAFDSRIRLIFAGSAEPDKGIGVAIARRAFEARRGRCAEMAGVDCAVEKEVLLLHADECDCMSFALILSRAGQLALDEHVTVLK